jgi:hypothetical protein
MTQWWRTNQYYTNKILAIVRVTLKVRGQWLTTLTETCLCSDLRHSLKHVCALTYDTHWNMSVLWIFYSDRNPVRFCLGLLTLLLVRSIIYENELKILGKPCMDNIFHFEEYCLGRKYVSEHVYGGRSLDLLYIRLFICNTRENLCKTIKRVDSHDTKEYMMIIKYI